MFCLKGGKDALNYFFFEQPYSLTINNTISIVDNKGNRGNAN